MLFVMNAPTKLCIVHRVTHYPKQIQHGKETAPESTWVAIGVNTQEVIAQDADKSKLISELLARNYVVQKITNDWN